MHNDLPVKEWENKLVYPKKYYSALKRNELLSHEKIWEDLECSVLKEINQSEKDVYGMIPTV